MELILNTFNHILHVPNGHDEDMTVFLATVEQRASPSQRRFHRNEVLAPDVQLDPEARPPMTVCRRGDGP